MEDAHINYFSLITGDSDDSGNTLSEGQLPYKQKSVESNCECIVLPSTNNPPISRSASLGIQFYHDHIKKQTKSIFPLSGYDDLVDVEEDLVIEPLLIRSNSVDAKQELVHHREYMTGSMYKSPNASYPDMTRANDKPPLLDHEIRITNQYGHIHSLTVKGSTIVVGTEHHNIRSYNIQECANALFTPIILTADLLEPISLDNASLPSTKSTKSSSSLDNVRSVCFSPAMYPHDDSKVVWTGTETGSILAIDIETDQIMGQRMATDGHPILFILRYQNTELWTLDACGNLNIWPILKQFTSSFSSHLDLSSITPQYFQVIQSARAAFLSENKSNVLLWLSNGRSIQRFDRSLDVCDQDWVHVPADLGDITQLFKVPCHPNTLFSMHADGQVSAWDEQSKQTLKSCIYLSTVDKLTSIKVVGDHHVWAGYEHGTMVVYDTRQQPWLASKLWKAHSLEVVQIVIDEFSILDTMAVVSMDSAGHIAIWDGLLADDWIENQTLSRIADYSESQPVNVMICSWNMDAVKPDALTKTDVEKLHEWLNGINDPDIIMIGVQEIVDLCSKTLTARSLLSLSKKIETIEDAKELLTHRYMLWYDYFCSIIDKNFGKNTYKILKTDQLVGLFTCIFIKTTHESRIRQCDSTVVKTGFRLMNKSLHGNKGGIATRIIFNDTSVCFVNCHLASGQSNIQARNADLEGILQTAQFPPIRHLKSNNNGSHILDHDLCFLSGDLNYRLNLERNEVVQRLQSTTQKFETWEALQYQDQLKTQQALYPFFRMFKEAPILFDPTYKYDRGTDEYDRSEKRRVPAWCDRILYRTAVASVTTNLYYRRHEVRASDHRPISAGFTFTAKTLDTDKMQQVLAEVKTTWLNQVLQKYAHEKQVRYITWYGLCDEKEASARLEKASVEQVVTDLYHDKGCDVFLSG